MSIISRIVEGYVRQQFDTDAQQWVVQEFFPDGLDHFENDDTVEELTRSEFDREISGPCKYPEIVLEQPKKVELLRWRKLIERPGGTCLQCGNVKSVHLSKELYCPYPAAVELLTRIAKHKETKCKNTT